ncbi:MAG: hypothetical protein ABSA40_07980 [Candidatus Dormibacteria bacterium]
MPDQSLSRRGDQRRHEDERPVRLGRVPRQRRSCGCRHSAAARPRCTRLHIPRVHLVV